MGSPFPGFFFLGKTWNSRASEDPRELQRDGGATSRWILGMTPAIPGSFSLSHSRNFFFWDLFSRIFLEKEGFACSAPWNGRESMESMELLESEGALKFSGIWEFPNHSLSQILESPISPLSMGKVGFAQICSKIPGNVGVGRRRRSSMVGGLGPGIPGKTWNHGIVQSLSLEKSGIQAHSSECHIQAFLGNIRREWHSRNSQS